MIQVGTCRSFCSSRDFNNTKMDMPEWVLLHDLPGTIIILDDVGNDSWILAHKLDSSIFWLYTRKARILWFHVSSWIDLYRRLVIDHLCVCWRYHSSILKTLRKFSEENMIRAKFNKYFCGSTRLLRTELKAEGEEKLWICKRYWYLLHSVQPRRCAYSFIVVW